MIKQKIVLQFPSSVVEQPFIYHLIKDYNWMVNLLKANINPRKEGRMVVEVTVQEGDYEKGLDYLQARGVSIHSLEHEIVWLQDRCTQCGACSVICPTGALHMNRPEMVISFDESRCIVCGLCLKACPARAMEEARF